MAETSTPEPHAPDEFDKLSREKRTGLLSEVWGLLSVTKKWWLLPILISILLLGGLVLLGGTGAGPFIYTLF